MSDLIVYTHKDCLKKYNGPNHPEKKERLETVIKSISDLNFPNIKILENSLGKLEDIYLVHPKEYIENIFKMIPKNGIISLEKEPYADTFLCPNTKNSILASFGSGICAANSIFNNDINGIFCAVRPPGHHAETNRANGFCFVNNIAITAKYLRKKFSIKKIGILDFDVHHCNGTQEIFYNDKDTFCGSIHEFPLFPGTGEEKEKGIGNIFNAPIRSKTESKFFIDTFRNKILSELDKFKPEIILISAGFDAHKNDNISSIKLESKDYYTITKDIINLSQTHCNGKIISFLEGGYDLKSLYESVQYHISAFIN